MPRLLLLRHGLVNPNQDDLYIGSSDAPLSAEGWVQTEAVGGRLASEGLAAIYSSPQLRARQMAQAIATACGLEVQIEPGLREMDFGCWEGLTESEIVARFPGQMQEWTADPAREPAPHGGETLVQVARRAMRAYEKILARCSEEDTVLIVGHGGTLQALLCEALGTPLRARWPYLLRAAALSELRVVEGHAALVSLNDCCHLHSE